MHAVVPAAGEGTRLRPLTESTPKPLLEVGGTPIIGRIFTCLADQDIESATVIVGHRASQIEDWLGSSQDGVRIEYVHQEPRRGLGHAISMVPQPSSPFVVINGDNVFAPRTPLPLQRVQREGVDGVLLVETASLERARTTGVVTVDGTRVTGIVEKPDDPPSTNITTGVYVLPPAAIPACRTVEPATGEWNLAAAIDRLISEGYHFEAVPFAGDRVNVNRPRDLERANRLVSADS